MNSGRERHVDWPFSSTYELLRSIPDSDKVEISGPFSPWYWPSIALQGFPYSNARCYKDM